MPKGKHKFSYDEIYLHTEEQAWELIQERPEQFYVYVLVNPLNNLPFYVGKGQGNRCFRHTTRSHNLYLSNFINKLLKKSKNILYVFELFTDKEIEAYNTESELISKFMIKKENRNGCLYNLDNGRGEKVYSLTQNKVIAKYISIHGDRYDYSKVVYKGNSFPVEILCKKHKSFWQISSKHIEGKGCPKCAGRDWSKQSLVEEFNKIHKKQYDYSNLNFINMSTKVTIICNKHKLPFYILPRNHLYGDGCPRCRGVFPLEERLNNFIKESSIIHNFKYSYEKTTMWDSSRIVSIYCGKHKHTFNISASHHLSGQGCPKCAKEGITKSVVQVDFNGKEVCTFDSILDASAKTGVSRGNIISVCKGNRLSAGGFIWKYLIV